MAPTRRSLPSTTTTTTTTTTTSSTSTSPPISSSASQPPQQEMTSKQKRVLAKLAIDAEPGLLLAPSSKQKRVGMVGTGKVYHYRGAVYELLGNEPEEWLAEERELERVEAERLRVEEVRRKDREEREEREREIEVERRRRMKEQFERDVKQNTTRKKMEDAAERATMKRKSEDEQMQRKKRRRMGEVEEKSKKRRHAPSSEDDEGDEDEGAHAPASKKRKPLSLAGREIDRTKHSVPTQPSYFPRPLAQPKRLKRADSGVAAVPYWPAPAPKAKRKRVATKLMPDDVLAEELRTKNFTNNGGREEYSCAEMAREQFTREMRVKAANESLQTEMLGTEVVRRGREYNVKRFFAELFEANKGVREKEGELREMREGREEVRRRRERGVAGHGGGRLGGQATEGAEDGVGKKTRGKVERSGVEGLGIPSTTDCEAGVEGGVGDGGEVRDSGTAMKKLGTKTAIPLAPHEQRLLGSGLKSARSTHHAHSSSIAAVGKDGDGDEAEGEERADSPFAFTLTTSYTKNPSQTYASQNSQADQNSQVKQKRNSEQITSGRAEPYLFGGRMVGESFVELERRQRWEEGVLGGLGWERVAVNELVVAEAEDLD
ncbi:hypothetical protein LTR15_012512 [Elasticomyces elasticus]|nr:hypothetical protein LTR15_012512 [Elasticomyces elasticus]